MDSQKRTLPDYSNPPVNEVVLGVQFDTLLNYSSVHPGLYWQNIRDDYPNYSIHPPIASVTETFGEPFGLEPKLRAEIFKTPPIPRCWFLDKSENRLIQLQSERFLHNWKKVTGEEEYPHYDSIFPEFKNQWESFLEFVEKEKLGPIKLNQWEVTYVNYIYQGKGWEDFGDLPKIFSFLSNDKLAEHLRTPEKISLSLAYSYPDKLARLHIDLTTAYKRPDNVLLLQFKLTARGQLATNDNQTLYESLDFGRSTIVENFTELTSEESHDLWKRII